jgi:hypothetical protein
MDDNTAVLTSKKIVDRFEAIDLVVHDDDEYFLNGTAISVEDLMIVSV